MIDIKKQIYLAYCRAIRFVNKESEFRLDVKREQTLEEYLNNEFGAPSHLLSKPMSTIRSGVEVFFIKKMTIKDAEDFADLKEDGL